MVTLLRKIIFRKKIDASAKEQRTMLGMLCSCVGIGLNILLFACKLTAGLISSSIAITADAFNNLSDAGASVVTLIGFRLAEQDPDREHPFGHGRMEYISGFIVAIAIILMAAELLKSSFQKILHPQDIVVTKLVLAFLIISICVKLYMVFYNKKIGKEIHSAAMQATAADSRNDCIATGAVLISSVIAMLTGLRIDGYTGFLVGLFVFWSGIATAKETISLLLGQPPEEAFVKEIEDLVMAHEHVVGVHDLVVHDYGPGRVMISLHAEVPADEDILMLHDMIDRIEKELGTAFHCEAVIHMDPVVTNDKRVTEMKQAVVEAVKALNPAYTLHDFRMVPGPTHTNLIYDIVVPIGTKKTDDEVRKEAAAAVKELDPRYESVITIDHPYVG